MPRAGAVGLQQGWLPKGRSCRVEGLQHREKDRLDVVEPGNLREGMKGWRGRGASRLLVIHTTLHAAHMKYMLRKLNEICKRRHPCCAPTSRRASPLKGAQIGS